MTKFLLPFLILFSVQIAQARFEQPLPLLIDAVEKFDAAQARVETLQCPFALTLRRALLRTPTLTKGTLYLKGSEFAHFAFSPPEDLILHLTPKTLISFSPAAKEGELLKIGVFKNANRKFLGLGQRLSYLQEYFQVGLGEAKDQPGALFFTLIPRTLGMKKRFQVVHIWVDRETWLPRRLEWVERSGDSWLLDLGPLQTNQTLPAAVTGFRVPEGTPLRSEFSFFATRKR